MKRLLSILSLVLMVLLLAVTLPATQAVETGTANQMQDQMELDGIESQDGNVLQAIEPRAPSLFDITTASTQATAILNFRKFLREEFAEITGNATSKPIPYNKNKGVHLALSLVPYSAQRPPRLRTV